MELFKKPKWLKPEINEAKYWVHIVILAVIVQVVLRCPITIMSTTRYGFAIALADVVAHTVLKLD